MLYRRKEEEAAVVISISYGSQSVQFIVCIVRLLCNALNISLMKCLAFIHFVTMTKQTMYTQSAGKVMCIDEYGRANP